MQLRLALVAIALLFSISGAYAEEKPAYAVIVRVEGNGSAMIRRKSGSMVAAAVNGSLAPGDKVITDSGSTVQVLLYDGALIRVGLNSEYKLESMSKAGGAFHWVFSLFKGSVRALVDRSPEPKEVKLQVDTPNGTIGVRGTELIVQHEDGDTHLFTLAGKVEFGPKECLAAKNCVAVTKGQASSLKKGDLKPLPPRTFEPGEVLGIKGVGASMTELREGAGFQRRLVMQTLLASEKGLGKLTKEEIDALLKKLQREFELVQAANIRRSLETKELMEKAMDEKLYAAYIEAAEKFMQLKGMKFPEDIDPASVAAAKFALAMELEKMGAFKEGGVSKARLGEDFVSRGFDPKNPFSSKEEIEAGTSRMSSAQVKLADKNPRVRGASGFLRSAEKCCSGCTSCLMNPPLPAPRDSVTGGRRTGTAVTGTASSGGSGKGCYKSVQDCSSGTCRTVMRNVDCGSGGTTTTAVATRPAPVAKSTEATTTSNKSGGGGTPAVTSPTGLSVLDRPENYDSYAPYSDAGASGP